MGLDDRDYMRERNRRTFNRTLDERERPFGPPPQQQSVLMMIFWWVLIAFALYKGYGWFLEQKAHRRASIVQPQYEPQRMDRRAPAPEVRTGPASNPMPRPVYTPQPTPEVTEDAAPQTGGTVYLCKDYSGGTFWASSHCNQHRALIDRMVSVPPGLPFNQQVQIAEQRRQALISSTTTTVEIPSAVTSNQGVAKKALCESLDARVTQLDSMARQPQSGSMQDWIRMERQKSRDEQFRLRC